MQVTQTATAKVKNLAGKATPGTRRQHLSQRNSNYNVNPCSLRKLFGKADVGARAVSIRIRAQCQINSLSCVLQVKVNRTAKSAGANSPGSTLELASTIHIKLIHDDTALNISDSDMEREKGLASAELPP